MNLAAVFRCVSMALVLACPLHAAQAVEVSPMRMVLDAPGIGASGRITVRNTEATTVPVEISVERRFVDIEGENRYESAEDDFVVFPPQALIATGTAQTFQFQYVGEPFTDASRAYVLRVSEVPLKRKSGVGLQVVYEFGVAVYIAPPGTRADLSLVSVAPLVTGHAVTVRNSGTRHAVLDPGELASIPGVSSQVSGSGDGTLRFSGNPIIPPRSTRRFVVGTASPAR